MISERYDARARAVRRAWILDGLRVGFLLALLMLLGGLGTELRTGALQTASEEAAQEGAGWEGRRLLARLMWVKSEQVLHGGVEHAAAAEAEAAPHHHDREEGEEAPHGHDLAILSTEEDFRGILGDIERSVKPYADEKGMETHRDQSQTLPFFRLMTWLDPHFVRGYTTGAAMLCDAGKHADVGLAFLQEGLSHNPDSFEIQMEVGRFHLVYFRKYALAERHLTRALELAPRGRELSEDEFSALTDTFRWLALCYSGWRKPADARRVARLGLKVIGPDVVLERVIQRSAI